MRVPTFQDRLKRITDRQSWLREFREAQRVEMEAKSWAKRQVPMPIRLDPCAYRAFPIYRNRVTQAQEVVRQLTRHAKKSF